MNRELVWMIALAKRAPGRVMTGLEFEASDRGESIHKVKTMAIATAIPIAKVISL